MNQERCISQPFKFEKCDNGFIVERYDIASDNNIKFVAFTEEEVTKHFDQWCEYAREGLQNLLIGMRRK